MKKIILLSLLSFMLVACSGKDKNVAKIIGLEQSKPDEFSISKNVPLTMPPNFSLRPVGEGQIEQRDSRAIRNAKQLFIKELQQDSQLSSSDIAILSLSNAEKTIPNIRAIVDEESTALAKLDAKLIDKILFWKTPTPPGTVISASQEQKRINADQALGQPITGEGSYIITREKEQSSFDKLFK